MVQGLVTAVTTHRTCPEVVVMALKTLKLLTLPWSDKGVVVKQLLCKEPDFMGILLEFQHDAAFDAHNSVVSDMMSLLYA